MGIAWPHKIFTLFMHRVEYLHLYVYTEDQIPSQTKVTVLEKQWFFPDKCCDVDFKSRDTIQVLGGL